MNLINNNPFRVLGLAITATEREIAKQINTLATFAEMGKAKTFDTDFSFLPPADRAPNAIEEAKKQIEQNENKLLYSLFWFWKNNYVDELNFEVLKEGNTQKAIGIWEKAVFANKHSTYKPIVLYANLIRQSNYWLDQDNENDCLKRNKEEFKIERKKETGSSISVVKAELNSEDNWTVECDTEWEGGTDIAGYGIVFGREEMSYYTFDICANGSYCYSKVIQRNYNEIISWKESDAIEKWSSNHILIKKINDQLKFYINGTFVDSFQSEPFFGKNFGFSVNSNQQILFKNFKFCKLVEDETYGEGITFSPKNFSSIKNLSVLYLSLAANNGTFQLDYFKKGIALAKFFFSTENIIDYSKLIAGERYIYNPTKTIHFYINNVIDIFKNYLEQSGGISTSQFINTFSAFPAEAKQLLHNKFVSKQIENIDKEIEIAETACKNVPENASDLGKTLINNTKSDILFLKNILSENDFQYQIIADKLSLAIIECGKTFLRATRIADVYLPQYEFAMSVAATQKTKTAAQEFLDLLKEYVANKHLFVCWFCGHKPPEERCEFQTTLYKKTSRNYNQIRISYTPVEIPRCNDCKKIHNKGSNIPMFAFVLSAIAGVIIGVHIDGHWLIGGIITGIIGGLLGSVIEDKQFSKYGIKGIDQFTIRDYPVIKKLLNEGWSFSKQENKKNIL